METGCRSLSSDQKPASFPLADTNSKGDTNAKVDSFAAIYAKWQSETHVLESVVEIRQSSSDCRILYIRRSSKLLDCLLLLT